MTLTTEQVEASRAIAAVSDKAHTTSLYSLSLEYVRVLETEDGDDVEAQLDQIHGDIRAKAESCAGLYRSLKALEQERKTEAKFHADAAKAFEAKAERLRAYVLRCMDNAGIERLDTGRFSLVPTDNPPAATVLDAVAIPHEFNRTKISVEPDLNAIKAHYRATGEVVPGIAITRGRSLRIS